MALKTNNLTRSLLGGFFLIISISCKANDFFGIPILNEPKDHLTQTIYYLSNSETKKAKESFIQLKELYPKLFEDLSLTDFSIPCPDFLDKTSVCQICNNKKNYFDKHALNYFQYKFDQFFYKNSQKNNNFQISFNQAYEIFRNKKNLVQERAIFQGVVYKKHQNYFIIKDVNEKFFQLFGTVYSSVDVGSPYVGYYWPVKKKSIDLENEQGDLIAIPSYTLTLWRDY